MFCLLDTCIVCAVELDLFLVRHGLLTPRAQVKWHMKRRRAPMMTLQKKGINKFCERALIESFRRRVSDWIPIFFVSTKTLIREEALEKIQCNTLFCTDSGLLRR